MGVWYIAYNLGLTKMLSIENFWGHTWWRSYEIWKFWLFPVWIVCNGEVSQLCRANVFCRQTSVLLTCDVCDLCNHKLLSGIVYISTKNLPKLLIQFRTLSDNLHVSQYQVNDRYWPIISYDLCRPTVSSDLCDTKFCNRPMSMLLMY